MTMAVATKKAVGYFRVSTQGQTGERHSSLETQQERFRLHCERHGYQPLTTFTDVASGRRDNRREYQRLLSYVAQGSTDVIVVQWLDRFGRNPREILRRYWALEEQGVSVEATDEDLKEEVVLLMKAWQAGAESKKISERVRANMSKAVAKGVHVGPAPYGLRRVRTLLNDKVVTTWELDPVEAPVVREMVRLMVEENRGYGGIANALHDRGIYNRSGHPWGAWAIKIILDNEAIIGDLVYGKKSKAGTASNELVRVPGFFPAIISAEEWNQLQQRRDIRRETPKGKTHSSEFLLSGLIRCGECGLAMKGHSGALRRDGSRYAHYLCTLASKSRARCSHYKNHVASDLEQVVLTYLGQYSDPQRVRELLAQKREEAPGLEQELASTEKRLADLEKDLLANLDLLKRGILNEDEFRKANETRRAEREALQGRCADLSARIQAQRHTEAQVDAVPEKVVSFLHAFQGVEPRLAKAQLQTILKAVHVYRDGRIELEFRQGP